MAFAPGIGNNVEFDVKKIKKKYQIDKNGIKITITKDSLPEQRIDIRILAFDCGDIFNNSKYVIWTSSVDLRGFKLR